VARQDPLDQRRAGARQADDEDGRTLHGRGVGRQRLGERARGRGKEPCVARGVVPERRALARATRLQVHERLVEPAEVLEFLGERVTHVQLCVHLERAGRERRFEPCEVIAVGCLAAQLRERRVRPPEARLRGETGPVGRLRGVEPAQELERRSQVELDARIAR
jgi:hypothetical protein